MSGRKFYQSNPELVELYNEEIDRQENEWLNKYYSNQGKLMGINESAENAATILSDKVDVSALNTADRKDYEGLGYFGLGASLMPAILAAGYPLPAILDTGGTALGFLGSPLTTTVQSTTNLVPSLAQYSWLQPSLFAGGIGTALTSCSSPEERKKEEKGSQQYNNKGKDSYIFKRRYPNDGPTQDGSESRENEMARTISSFGNKVNHDYDIPYIDSLEIKIPGFGRVSSNALDSLAKYANIADIPLKDAIGLAAHETNFGAIPHYSVAQNIDEDLKHKIEREVHNASFFRNFGRIPANSFVNDYHFYDLPDSTRYITPPLLHAFEYFKSGNYNRGNKRHTKFVQEAGKKAMKTDAVKTWEKNSKFVKQN